MSERQFRLSNPERAPGPVVRALKRFRTSMTSVALVLIAFPSFLATQFHAPMGSVSLTDFTQIWAYLLIGGVLVLVFGMIGAYLSTGVGPKKVIAVGGLAGTIILIAIAGAWFSPAVASGTVPSANGTTAAVAVSLPSSGYPTGQTLSLSPLSVTVDTVMNSSTAAGAMCLQNGVGATHACLAASHNYIVIPVKLSRTDNINATYGFTICLNNIATLTNASTGIVYADLGYVAASSSSPGIWKVQWNTGSIGGSNPTNPAPQTTTNVACDLVGVPAFGSATAVLSISLPGSNSTSANFGYLATQYGTYGFNIVVSGGAGATPASVPVNIVYTGAKNA